MVENFELRNAVKLISIFNQINNLIYFKIDQQLVEDGIGEG